MKKFGLVFSGVCFFLFIISFQVFKIFESLEVMKFSYSMLALSIIPLLVFQVKGIKNGLAWAGIWRLATVGIDTIFAATILFLVGVSPLENKTDPTLFIAIMLALAAALFFSLTRLNIALRKRHIRIEKRRMALA
jgi:hypothetical protein